MSANPDTTRIMVNNGQEVVERFLLLTGCQSGEQLRRKGAGAHSSSAPAAIDGCIEQCRVDSVPLRETVNCRASTDRARCVRNRSGRRRQRCPSTWPIYFTGDDTKPSLVLPKELAKEPFVSAGLERGTGSHNGELLWLAIESKT